MVTTPRNITDRKVGTMPNKMTKSWEDYQVEEVLGNHPRMEIQRGLTGAHPGVWTKVSCGSCSFNYLENHKALDHLSPLIRLNARFLQHRCFDHNS